MIAVQLRQLMSEKHFSVTALANESGISKSTIRKILKGERGHQPSHRTIIAIAKALGTTPDVLMLTGERDKPISETEREYRNFATLQAELTVLTDHALAPEETYRDSFNLRYKLGPIYDILRHPETQTPMAIAIYGDWGTGKTTAMKWLHGLINHWNKHGTAKRKIKIRPVWFYAWKYENKEDVWRGLIQEVVINSIDAEHATTQIIKNAAKQFGLFLGRSFLHVLARTKLKAESSDPAGEADLASIAEILAEYKEATHPERPYLNEFESSLEIWIKSTLSEDERMVIFIDDLDRCMPDITLQVLKALQLYLNIERLIFVVGVDRNVVDKLVKKHYKFLGLNEDKSKNYLAKMFQVEVQVEPSEQQISDFLDEQLKQIPYWKEPYLSESERGIFRDVIFKLAERNPREVKRLINSALITGSGAMMIKSAAATEGGIRFNQGLQLFFVRKILDERYTMGSEVGSKRGIAFFQQWSQIVHVGKQKDRDFHCSVKVPSDFSKAILIEVAEAEIDFVTDGYKSARLMKEPKLDLSFAPPEYHPLLKNQGFSGLLHLLADEDLGELMRVSYPAEVAEITAVVGTSKDVDIIHEAIARQLDKKPDEVTNEDYINVEVLDLGGADIAELEPIKKLTALKELRLSSTTVSHFEPIKALKNLQRLYLKNTKLSDLEPIKELSKLQVLNINGTKVSNLELIKGLHSLLQLDLKNTRVCNLEPIKELSKLQGLNLSGTKVSNLEPIKGLSSLQELDLRNTPVSNLEPIKELSKLQGLNLSATKVSNLEPIKGLSRLQSITLDGSRVSDLEPIKGLNNLRSIDLRDTQVRYLGPIKGLRSLEWLDLRGTHVSDEEVGKLRKELQKLTIKR